MSLILLAIPTIFIGFISYYLWIWTYWRRRGITGPLGYPIVGSFPKTLKSEYPQYLQIRDWTKQYGSVFGYTEGTIRTLVVSDSDLVHELFVKQYDNFYGRRLNPIQGDPEKDPRTNLFSAQGFRWKRLRAISSPTFSNNSLRKINLTVEDSALELLRHIEEQTSVGEQIDMLQFYQEFTMDVIGRIAMGQNDSQMFKNPLLNFVKAIFGDNRKHIPLIGGVFPSFAQLFRFFMLKLPFLGAANFIHVNNTMIAAVNNRIAQRENDAKNGMEIGEPQDFIDLFLDARADDVEHFGENNGDFSKSSSYSNRQLTTSEIVGQCIVFLIAGFDTTALSLSYSTFLLATHPEIQSKLQEEVDRECTNPEISFDQLSKLKYMDCVIKETLRLYPLGTLANSRRCMRATKLGDVEVEVGTTVQVDTWSLHTDPKIWGDDAKEFKPERWLSADSDLIFQKGGYIPFGLGPRQCIGMRLAYMEEKMLLAHILRKFTFVTGVKTDIPLKLHGRATTQPESVWMHLKPRH
ncbi:CRE-CYP-13A10 protein [Caenorhabditis remanei]|uniref:CRE-CYP-13A10 protein n=1 Tax=Caenorhabditis remanei TaxID=31234 RepID=E3NB23_CAERE|nr:CRE-CYP-13A10 protein [Caenorhabditis remanei]